MVKTVSVITLTHYLPFSLSFFHKRVVELSRGYTGGNDVIALTAKEICAHTCILASQVGLAVKNLLSMQETKEMGVRALGQEDPLEEGMVSHSSVLAWKIPWTEEPGRLQSMGSQNWIQPKRLGMHILVF